MPKYEDEGIVEDNDDLETEEGGKKKGKGTTAIIAAFIVVIWIAIFALLVKLDVGGFGSSVLYPVLKDVPVLNKILPNVSDNSLSSNSGDTLEKYLPQLYVMESEQPDNSKMHLSLQPVSLYEEINAAGVDNYDIDLCIPPGQTVTVSYSVTVSDYQEIQALRDDGKTVFVSLSNRKAKQNVCVPLQWMEIETGEKGGI